MKYCLVLMGDMCAGKSHLSRRLERELGFACLHLDDEFWFGDWKHIEKDELARIAEKFIEENEKTVIDGNYPFLLKTLKDRASCIVVCERNLLITTFRAGKRVFQKEDTPAKVKEARGKETHLLRLISQIHSHRASQKKKYEKQFEELKIGDKIIHLKTNKKNINRFVKKLEEETREKQ